LCDAEPIVDWAAIGWIEVVEYTPAISSILWCNWSTHCKPDSTRNWTTH